MPRDLSVIGFDDTSAAIMVWSEPTTIHPPVASLADAAIDVPLREIRRAPQAPRTLADHVVPHRRLERASVSAVGNGSPLLKIHVS